QKLAQEKPGQTLEATALVLPGRLPERVLRRQLSQLLIDQRQELLCGVGTTFLDGGQHASCWNSLRRSRAADAPGCCEVPATDDVVAASPAPRTAAGVGPGGSGRGPFR